jgi:hypothetical protein
VSPDGRQASAQNGEKAKRLVEGLDAFSRSCSLPWQLSVQPTVRVCAAPVLHSFWKSTPLDPHFVFEVLGTLHARLIFSLTIMGSRSVSRQARLTCMCQRTSLQWLVPALLTVTCESGEGQWLIAICLVCQVYLLALSLLGAGVTRKGGCIARVGT